MTFLKWPPLSSVLLFLVANFHIGSGRVFHPCELGRILLNQGIQYEVLGDWICLANAASRFMSSKIGGHYTNPTNSQYGIFQLSDYWYCFDESRPLPQYNECGLNCRELIDDDLVDDINCAKLVYKRGPNSFRLWWYIFDQFCGNSSFPSGNVNYHQECDFENGSLPQIMSPNTDATIYLDQVVAGQEVLNCTGQGSLPIDIKWYKNQDLVNNQTDPDLAIRQTINAIRNQTISIITIRHSNFGPNEYVKVLSCEAENKYGRTRKEFLLKIVKPVENPNEKFPIELIAAIVLTGIIIITIGSTLYCKFIGQKNVGLTPEEIRAFYNGEDRAILAGNENDGNLANLHGNILSEPYNKEFEINKSDLTFDKRDLIGSGQFGLVYKGIYKSKEVAVKTVKSGSNKTDLLCLLSELKALIYIQGHPNIVTLVGAYTKEFKKGIAFILLEYYPLGNLMKYLQNIRNSEVGKEIDVQVMLGWSYQIANAMEFLSSKKVVHGDLATRNILLFSPTVIKITDFGLSRKLYDYATYVKGEKDGEPLLPWRWSAPETLSDLKFSSSSDVWSYGITLWEIFSFASVPYPGFSLSGDFIRKLEGGLRLTQPTEATDSVFKIMEECWKLNPSERPSFTSLRQSFYLEVKKYTNEVYIELDLADAKCAAYYSCGIIY